MQTCSLAACRKSSQLHCDISRGWYRHEMQVRRYGSGEQKIIRRQVRPTNRANMLAGERVRLRGASDSVAPHRARDEGASRVAVILPGSSAFHPHPLQPPLTPNPPLSNPPHALPPVAVRSGERDRRGYCCWDCTGRPGAGALRRVAGELPADRLDQRAGYPPTLRATGRIR